MANETGVPPLIDLRVLSPMAWVQREKERMETQAGAWSSLDREGEIETNIHYIRDLERGAVEHGEGPEGTRRRIEYTLIQIAAHAVLALESIRYQNQMVNKDGSED